MASYGIRDDGEIAALIVVDAVVQRIGVEMVQGDALAAPPRIAAR